MDNLTHSLVGALIGQAGLKRTTGLAMPALVIGANLPDVDAACFFWLDGVQHLGFRRGITHGPVAWVLLPLALAAILWGLDRWQARRGTRPDARLPVRFAWLYALAFLACLTHPALDWLNVYGIRLLEPFSSRWFYGDVLFIIDVWLWAGLGFATWLSLRRERRGGHWRKPAAIALVAAVGYIVGNATGTREEEQMEMVDAAYSETIAAPVPFAFWRRDMIFVNPEGRHAVIAGHAGPTARPLHVERLGDALLASCDLEAAARADRDVAAFLFWSRAPFVERGEGGTLRLRDARFADPRVGDRFSVPLPVDTCDQFYERAAGSSRSAASLSAAARAGA